MNMYIYVVFEFCFGKISALGESLKYFWVIKRAGDGGIS